MSVGRRPPPPADLALAGSLAVLGVVELQLSYPFEGTDRPGPLPLHVAVAIASAGVLPWRRRLPLLVAPIASVLLALETFAVVLPNVYVSSVVLVVALYSLVVYAPTWRSAVVPLVVVVVSGALMGAARPGGRHGIGDQLPSLRRRRGGGRCRRPSVPLPDGVDAD